MQKEKRKELIEYSWKLGDNTHGDGGDKGCLEQEVIASEKNISSQTFLNGSLPALTGLVWRERERERERHLPHHLRPRPNLHISIRHVKIPSSDMASETTDTCICLSVREACIQAVLATSSTTPE